VDHRDKESRCCELVTLLQNEQLGELHSQTLYKGTKAVYASLLSQGACHVVTDTHTVMSEHVLLINTIVTAVYHRDW
jgi:hypothetical protein